MSIDIKLLKDSFEEIKPVANQVADHFYESLFKNYPQAKPLFKMSRLDSQKKSLIQSLVTIFENIENQSKLKSYLESLGARHTRYGVKDEHYEWVAESLLGTLKYFFDSTWTPELEDAWMAAIGLISETMKAGARNAAAVGPVVVEDTLKDEIDSVIVELIKGSIFDAVSESEIREMAATKARSLIKEALQEQLALLKEKFKSRKAA